MCKIKWERVFDGCWHCYDASDAGRNPLIILDQNDFGRRLWTVELVGYGKQTDGSFDCFHFKLAKRLGLQRWGEKA